MMQHAATSTALRFQRLLPALPGAPLRPPTDPGFSVATGPADAAAFDTLGEALAAMLGCTNGLAS